MKRLLPPILFALTAVGTPAFAQTPPTQGWPAARPADQTAPQAKPPQTTQKPAPAATPPAQTATGTPPPVPLPLWFVEIDTEKKGEVSRADFLKYRMKSFDQLDTNKDGKLSLEEFVKVAEPPFSHDVANGPSLDERRNRAKAEFGNLDTNRDGFVERAETEALIHSEFNQYDTDRDNKVTEPEVRLIVQRSIAREQQERQQMEQRRRQGMAAVNDFIDMQLREADKLDKNNDVKISQQEYVTLAGPADGPQAQGLLPYDIRRQLVLRKFQEIDTNKDGVLDRVEMTASAVKQFIEMDANKDRFLNEEEFKKAQEAETKKMRAIIQAMQPAKPAPAPAQRPAPAQPRPQPQQAPPGLAPGLPQGTR
ncbi:MAG: EF-hand domain-containing protein [Reyranella sp.]|uniref:EF-hand domain-containing protein n=1 Tax=Reyranella sp. TaxID=1929291 RepID=UPI003D0E5F34